MSAALLLWLGLTLFTLDNPTSLDDGLRHFAMAREMARGGLGPTWSTFLYAGAGAELRADPWFLSDLLLSPLTGLGVVAGLKAFVLVQAVLILGAFGLLLRTLELSPVGRSVFLLLLFGGDYHWVGRLLLGRPFGLITAASIALLWALVARKWLWVVPLLAASVLLSQLFVFPLCICAAVVVWTLRDGGWRRARPLAAAVAAGLGLGFLLHPHAGEYLHYLVRVFLRIPFQGSAVLSREMQSGLGDGSFVSVAVVAGAALLLAHFARVRLPLPRGAWGARGIPPLALLVGLFFGAYAVWVRAIDLLWPLLLALAAAVASLHPELPRRLLRSAVGTHAEAVLPILVAALCAVQLAGTSIRFRLDDSGKALGAFESVLRLPTRATVLNADWASFFPLVALRPDLTYFAGIDPSFTALADPEAARLLGAMRLARTDGEQAALLGALLDRYPSRYLALTRSAFPRTVAAAGLMPRLRLFGDTRELVIFEILR